MHSLHACGFCLQSKKHSYACCKEHEKTEDGISTSKTKDVPKVSPVQHAVLYFPILRNRISEFSQNE